jgi:hypothetical protein
MQYYVYGLVDPVTHLVRYVVQTTDLNVRFRLHCSARVPTTRAWVRSLPQAPILVILETGERKRVRVKGGPYVRAATISETKWLKRFRRTVINKKLRANLARVWDSLVNPDEQAPTP